MESSIKLKTNTEKKRSKNKLHYVNYQLKSWARERGGGEGVEGPANATRRVTLFNCQHFDGQCSHTHSHTHALDHLL